MRRGLELADLVLKAIICSTTRKEWRNHSSLIPGDDIPCVMLDADLVAGAYLYSSPAKQLAGFREAVRLLLRLVTQ